VKRFLLALAVVLPVAAWGAEPVPVKAPYFGIRVLDEVTGNGVPLVELRTVDGISQFTDNAGWVAFYEPGLMNREVYWHIRGPGIERAKDGFGHAGFRAETKPGTATTVTVKNTNIATRLGRLTGQGLYSDSAMLGLEHPALNRREPGVVGQDSVQAVPYQGKLFWLWGDTSIERYPLGNFHTTCANTAADAHPENGLQYDYFIDPKDPKRLRKMLPSKDPGVVWMFGLTSLTNPDSNDRLFSGFTRQQGLVPPDERGIAEFDDETGQFRKVADVAKDDEWHMPAGCAVRVTEAADDYVYFCTPYAYRRVAALPEAIIDPQQYEMHVFDSRTKQWQWIRAKAPTTQEDEARLLKSGAMKPNQSRYQLTDAATEAKVAIHTASIRWNAWRKKYVLIGVQAGGDRSYLGEVWYAESSTITGPWRKAVKIASHPKYSYYNPVHHPFFDREGGRLIYFEGTYTHTFSGTKVPTPRYEYNQLMYRLDLSDVRLEASH